QTGRQSAGQRGLERSSETLGRARGRREAPARDSLMLIALGNLRLRRGLVHFDSSVNSPIRERVFAPFPLTLSLSRWERERRASRSGKPRSLDCSLRSEWFTLS